ncbi:MAG TPA: hypothetical protein VGK17_19375 [Propionicimonas sp.]
MTDRRSVVFSGWLGMHDAATPFPWLQGRGEASYAIANPIEKGKVHVA